jgi:hypothetical protein
MKNSLNLMLSYKLLILFLVTIFFSCQKGIQDKDVTGDSSSRIVPSAPKAEHEDARVAIDWYKLQLSIILKSNPAYSPLRAGRIFAYEGMGLYEAVRNGIKNSVSLSELLYQMPAMPEMENNNGYSWSLVANAALASMVRSFYPSLTVQNNTSIDSLENAYNEILRPNLNSEVFERSQRYGRAVAESIFNWSKTDNDNQSNAGYVPPVFPGSWVLTPPAFAAAFCPYLGTSNRPFLEVHKTGVAPALLFSYSTEPSSDFYKMVKDIYDVSLTLSQDQKNIALFWNDVGVGIGFTPHGHSISIATQVLENQQASLATAAMAYAKMGIASWDAGIICFRSKYTYNIVRPVTYIRQHINPNWLPFIGTPPHPEYPAAHAHITLAEMVALGSVLGENYSFTDHTYDFLGYPPRNYSSFHEAGVESGISRRYGGIHYLPSIETGLIKGEEVGKRVADLKLIH